MMMLDQMNNTVGTLMKAPESGHRYQAALGDFLAMTGTLPVSDVVYWQNQIRNAMHYSGVKRRFLPFLNRPGRPTPIIPWLDLFNGNGYRRERVLHQTSEAAPNAFLLAVLFRLLNDWVPNVRKAARTAVKRVVDASETDVVVDAIWATFTVIGSWRRLSDADRATVSDLMDSLRIVEGWIKKLYSQSKGPISTIMSQAFRSGGVDEFLPEIAENGIRPIVRARAYRMMLEGRASWPDGWRWRWVDKSLGQRVREKNISHRPLEAEFDFVNTFEKALSDRAIIVRRVAGDILIARWPEFEDRAENWARTLALSDHPSLAERGVFVLRKLSERKTGNESGTSG